MQRGALLIRRNRQYQNINRRFPQQCEPGDVYVIRWYENKGTKTRYQNVGTDLNEASRLRLQEEMTLSQPTAEIVPEKASEGLQTTIATYPNKLAAQRKSEATQTGYAYTLHQFVKVCQKPVKEIAKSDLEAFEIAMLTEGLGDRTIDNRIGEVVTFLRAHGVKEVTHSHKFTEKKVRAYRPDELKLLFTAADSEEWIMFQFFLGSGCREQEVMNAKWDDMDFVEGIFTVREKGARWVTSDVDESEVRRTRSSCSFAARVPVLFHGEYGRARFLRKRCRFIWLV